MALFNLQVCFKKELRAIVLLVCFIALAPLLSHAQTAPAAPTADELHSAILSTLLTDPRTANIAPDKMQQLVDALATEAQSRSLTVNDIRAMIRTSIPGAAVVLGPAPKAEAAEECSGMFPALCPFNDAFGFDGSDLSIVIWFILATILVFVFLLKMKHPHPDEIHTTPTPPWSGPQA